MVEVKSEEINGLTDVPEKSAKQLQKEANKQAKLDKFKQKLEKKNTDKTPKVKEKIVSKSNFSSWHLIFSFLLIYNYSVIHTVFILELYRKNLLRNSLMPAR